MREKGLDYRTLASLAGVSHTYLWQLAGGGNQAQGASGRRPKRPSREVAIRIAEVLGFGIQDALEAAGYAPQLAELDARPAIVRYTNLRPDVPAIFQRGLDEARRGHPDRAVILLKEAVSHGGVSFIRAHAGLGVAYMGMRDHDAAVREFTKAIDLFRQAPDGTMASAGCRSRDGVELADVLYNRGLAYQDSGRHREAVADLRAAIAEGGPHPDLYYAALCFSELALGRFRRVLTAALEFEAPGAAGSFTTAALDVRLYQAYALARLGQFEAGLALSEAVGLLCPTYWYSSFVQGAILSRYLSKLASAGRRLADRVSPARQAKIDALLDAAHRCCARMLQLNPTSRESIQAERDEDFAFLAQHPAFSEFFSPSLSFEQDVEQDEVKDQDRVPEPDACAS